ncbi:hypothetical protein H9P43_005939 [Blastocladiella emersonii ATCC 22665]|nr:hypothetical protein H9P43_005939 [Blastocladiella emersonii ATCC 22665]
MQPNPPQPAPPSGPTVLAVTYNVNRFAVSDDLSSIAVAAGAATANSSRPPSPTAATTSSERDGTPDLIAVGLQEAAPATWPAGTHAPALVHASPAVAGLVLDPVHVAQWQAKVLRDLGCSFVRRAYRPLATADLGGALLLVLVAADACNRVADVRTATCAVGPLLFPNKGAVGVSFDWDVSGTGEGAWMRVALVNAHLPHGQKPGVRIDAWHDVQRRLVFTPSSSAGVGARTNRVRPASAERANEGNSTATSSPARQQPARHRSREGTRVANGVSHAITSGSDSDEDDQAPLLGVRVASPTPRSRSRSRHRGSATLSLSEHDHDAVILMGDLNFRLTAPSFAAVASDLAARRWPALVARDQLATAFARGVLGVGWTEGAIGFPPTYRTAVQNRGSPAAEIPAAVRYSAHSLTTADGDLTEHGRVTSYTSLNPEGAKLGTGYFATQPADACSGVHPVGTPLVAPPSTPDGAHDPAVAPIFDPRRIPGYTDRVLVRASPGGWACAMYASFPHLTQSDHVPVAAVVVLGAATDRGGQRARGLGSALNGDVDAWWAAKARVTAAMVWVLQHRARAAVAVVVLVAVPVAWLVLVVLGVLALVQWAQQ